MELVEPTDQTFPAAGLLDGLQMSIQCVVCHTLPPLDVAVYKCTNSRAPHFICKSCNGLIRNNALCVVCQSAICLEPDTTHESVRRTLIVKCEHASLGCTFVCPMGDMDVHLPVCQYRLVRCQHRYHGCMYECTAAQMVKHTKLCVITKCMTCGAEHPTTVSCKLAQKMCALREQCEKCNLASLRQTYEAVRVFQLLVVARSIERSVGASPVVVRVKGRTALCACVVMSMELRTTGVHSKHACPVSLAVGPDIQFDMIPVVDKPSETLVPRHNDGELVPAEYQHMNTTCLCYDVTCDDIIAKSVGDAFGLLPPVNLGEIGWMSKVLVQRPVDDVNFLCAYFYVRACVRGTQNRLVFAELYSK